MQPNRSAHQPIVDRFLAVNRKRLQLARATLSPRQTIFLDALPLLLHVNHALLPGYVSQNTPASIRNYSPDGTALKALKKLARAFTIDRRVGRQHDILAVYCMGSSGTIAHSDTSDFDVWLCPRPGLSPQALAELAEKTRLIEAWGSKDLRLEVHFFLIDPVRFRRGEMQQLSGENSGSTQHYFLLDEFYRSSLLIAGSYPLWWLVPPEYEHEYDTYARKLQASNAIDAHDFVDLGGLSAIPAEEFFGACLWQLYKSVNSPYKSLLKLLLIEVYASEYPRCHLLSNNFKQAVYAESTELEATDPYLLMYQKIEEYLMGHHETVRLNLLRRSFYLKVNQDLSVVRGNSDEDWRRRWMRRMVESWDWAQHQLELLDRRDHWKLDTVLEERKDLISALTYSYRMLSQFARQHANVSRIKQSELNILGRKLYAAFDRKVGKIELVNRGICPDLRESNLTLHQVVTDRNAELWLLYRGVVPEHALGEYTPMKRAASLIEILVWGYLNKIIDSRANIALFCRAGSALQREIRLVISKLETLFPNGRVQEASMADLSRSPTLNTAALFINVGSDPNETNPNGLHLTSSRTNALSYGGLRQNLALTFDFVMATSWEEVFVHRYAGGKGLLECLCECMRWNARPQAGGGIPAYCFSSSYGAIISDTIGGLFADILQSLLARPPSTHRYVLEVEDTFYILQMQKDAPSFERCETYQALAGHLAAPRREFSHVMFNKNALIGSPLPAIYEHNRENKLQLFLHAKGKYADIYILDENGSMFYAPFLLYDKKAILDHFHEFFSRMLNRRYCTPRANQSPEIGLEYHEIRQYRNNQYQLVPLDVSARGPTHYLSIEVLVSKRDGDTVFSIFCDNEEFSSDQHGDALFGVVARRLLALRASGLCYPIYITDIDLSSQVFGKNEPAHLQSIHYLHYKKKMEDRLTRAIHVA